jgi:hypothetical protein
VIEAYLSNQGVREITEISLPILSHPGKLIVHPDPEPKIISTHVILLAYVGKVQITYTIILVEADQKSIIRYGNITGHESLL